MVSNPSRDYSAFLLSTTILKKLIPRVCFKPFQGLFRVSTQLLFVGSINPSQGFKPFQGLFRVSTHAVFHIVCTVLQFQTLPGIIPRFYLQSSGFIRRPLRCFKPFQGLFRVSTQTMTPIAGVATAFQTLPGIIPRFYGVPSGSKHYGSLRFKPFQGLFRVSTKIKFFNGGFFYEVSNPSRDYSAFLRT
ncbi:hypothetical protein U27_01536 [Candidatus Vecturithrix granuli]|uniref:Uncharacterized protein n=1 Tax=Vecturithrix granuli TaxID=1499967 RepID=A0A081CAN0_VECG1|nr:hypothetical protein U27_01536 [Candidatus Vecturithrix granuli]